jgi:hypothetical protein
MQVLGTIKDATSGEFLERATIEVLTFDGKPTGRIVQAQYSGAFELEVAENAKMLITHVGFRPTLVDADYFRGGAVLELDRADTELEAVTVTVKKKSKTNWLLYLVGAAVVTKLLKLW